MENYRGAVVTPYQIAASAIALTGRGIAYIWAEGAHCLDCRLVDAAMRGTAGMRRGRASALVNVIVGRACRFWWR